jgi:hypothetical protein
MSGVTVIVSEAEIVNAISEGVSQMRRRELQTLRDQNSRLRYRIKERRKELGLPETDEVEPSLAEFKP